MLSTPLSVLATGLAILAPFASAYTQPNTTADPSGNAIYTPSLDELVPVGKGFNITWDPASNGTIALLLLKGPASDAEYYSTIADGISNNGSYLWTPSTDLAPGTSGYGIELVVEGTGQYQYSTQFGISNPGYSNSSSPSSSSAGASASRSASGASSTLKSMSTAASSTKSSSTTTSGVASSTGAAERLGVSAGGLVLAAGFAVMAL